MTNKFFLIFSLLLCANCDAKMNLKEPVHLSYSDNEIMTELTLSEKVVRNHEKKVKYYYYGIMKFNIIARAPEKLLIAVYKDQESKIYLDTMASVVDTWYYGNGSLEDLKENKAYVVFDDPEISWNEVKIITREGLPVSPRIK